MAIESGQPPRRRPPGSRNGNQPRSHTRDLRPSSSPFRPNHPTTVRSWIDGQESPKASRNPAPHVRDPPPVARGVAEPRWERGDLGRQKEAGSGAYTQSRPPCTPPRACPERSTTESRHPAAHRRPSTSLTANGAYLGGTYAK
ncbi:hypothetical protein E2562_033939 [Oryza meyeriana var. granulata]|uniref:Uncharacterized protein n=1 Tax=Oryza meyeriana var. granulata TaxID=110450 RepID=A0A6G1CBF4_9ORYZ|nr:hypothetical protein E2562_033939 [Oryza meyeriana var. granulata]